jgi:sterol 3beta-glucosyltransferase
MSTVVIIAVGSRGDVAPLTGVGVALQRAGHEVAIVAYTPFGDMITDSGLEFRELPAKLELAADGAEVAPMKGLAAFALPTGMRALGNDVVAAVAGEPADILMLSPFAEMAGHPLAEAMGIHALGVRLQPLSATKAYPPAVLGAWSACATGNQLAAGAGAWLVDRTYGGVVAGLRHQLGLPKVAAGRSRRRRTEAHWTVLHGYSPRIAPRPTDWRPGLEVAGYWWPAPVIDWTPPATLTDFLAAGPAPVFVGFGSTMTTAPRAERISDIVRRAAQRAGVRTIVQAGWTSLDVVGDDMLTIGEAPHEWLFPQVAAVAHHCGAGTTAAGVRAGVPTICLPGHGDGPFWARRLEELGVSAGTIPQRRLVVDRVADAMRVAAGEPQLRENTRQLASRIAAEDGAAAVVSAVESLLRQST